MTLKKPKTLAIIGGGQLGMFLCKAAARHGIRTVIVAEDAQAPALSFAGMNIVAPLNRGGLAESIALVADYVTFEFEAVPERLLQALAEQEDRGRLIVRPGIEVLKLLQNKVTQKQWLQERQYPTLPFVASEHPPAETENLIDAVGLPFVQKTSGGGYDGYGVQVIRSRQDFEKLWDVPSVIEACAEKPVELSVVVARALSGDSVAFHPVRMTFDQQKNVLDAVHSPTGLGDTVENMATWLAQDVVQGLDGIGVFAVEMFLLPDNRLFINEISPRVHNSGHHTMDVGAVSQFEQHVRAVCELPLVDPGAEPPAAIMTNLLYTDDLDFLLNHPAGQVDTRQDDFFVHWYGKKEPRVGRKMGHITVLGVDENEARRRVSGMVELVREPAEGAAA